MSKKGRVGGTIGFILALALVGGTVVYSTMFDPNAAAKMDKPLGSSTGNIVSAYVDKEGLEETQKLAAQTLASTNWFAPAAQEAEYSSYSLTFDYSVNQTITLGKTTAITSMDLDGAVYYDANYTYLKMNVTAVADRTATSAYTEIFYVKETGAYWCRTLPYTQNPDDSAMLDEADWAMLEEESIGSLQAMDFTAVSLQILLADNTAWKFDYLSGQFNYERKGAGAECSFTVGYKPRLIMTVNSSFKEGENAMDSSIYYLVHYSNLNNTVVNVPESLKAKLGV